MTRSKKNNVEVEEPLAHHFTLSRDRKKWLHLSDKGTLIAIEDEYFEGKRSHVYLGAIRSDSDEIIMYSNIVAIMQSCCDTLKQSLILKEVQEHGVVFGLNQVHGNTLRDAIRELTEGQNLEIGLIANKYIYLGKQFTFTF